MSRSREPSARPAADAPDRPARRIDAVCSTVLLIVLAALTVARAPQAMLLGFLPTISGTASSPGTAAAGVLGPLSLIVPLVAEPIAVHRLLLRRPALPLLLGAGAATAALALSGAALTGTGWW